MSDTTTMIRGLHHITATVNDAQDDLDCYVKSLGLRLVKKTVNFDNHNVYHFYYGNEIGVPGTLMTTFPYKGQGVRVGVHGAGQITATAFSIPADSVEFWKSRLTETGLGVDKHEDRFGEEVLSFTDPSGLVIELIAAPDDDREPWLPKGLDRSTAIRGIYAPTLSIRNADASIRFLEDMLGWKVVVQKGARTRLAVDGNVPGHRIDILHTPDAPDAVNGLGTVHHVAMGVDNDEDQLAIREKLVSRGVNVTPVRDRQYFHSIYFREPGGVLYEVATLPPGFLIDEDRENLGESLKLPAWEEKNRSDIEAGLVRISV